MAKNQEKARSVGTGGRGFDGERVGIFGASGSGKTTLARQILRSTSRVIIFDSFKREWEHTAAKWLGGRIRLCKDMKELRKALEDKFQEPDFRIVFCPLLGEEVVMLDKVCNLLLALQADYGRTHKAKITLFVEEAQEGIPTGTGQKNKQHGALMVAKAGRALGINMIVASQRMTTVDIGVRANLSYHCIFRLAEASDIQAAAEYVHDKLALRVMRNLEYYLVAPGGEVKLYKLDIK